MVSPQSVLKTVSVHTNPKRERGSALNPRSRFGLVWTRSRVATTAAFSGVRTRQSTPGRKLTAGLKPRLENAVCVPCEGEDCDLVFEQFCSFVTPNRLDSSLPRPQRWGQPHTRAGAIEPQ